MSTQKFIIACLKEVENKDELDFIWSKTPFKNDDVGFKAKTALLKKILSTGKFFDIPTEPSAEYHCIEAIFLSFEWKWVEKLQKIKEYVNEL